MQRSGMYLESYNWHILLLFSRRPQLQDEEDGAQKALAVT